MSEKNFFFIIAIPKDELIEYTTKLNSYISTIFPGKKNPFTLKPLEIRDEDALAKVTIRTTEAEMTDFARRFFGSGYEFIEREDGEVEIISTSEEEIPGDEGNGDVIKH